MKARLLYRPLLWILEAVLLASLWLMVIKHREWLGLSGLFVAGMKIITADKSAEREPLEKRFQRFARALMAVPKKELDKELIKDERKKLKRKSGTKHAR